MLSSRSVSETECLVPRTDRMRKGWPGTQCGLTGSVSVYTCQPGVAAGHSRPLAGVGIRLLRGPTVLFCFPHTGVVTVIFLDLGDEQLAFFIHIEVQM